MNEARLPFDPKTNGTFTVIVDSSPAEGSGTYRLHLVRLPGTVSVPPSDQRRLSRGTTTLGDLDGWSVEAKAGDHVLLRLVKLTGDSNNTAVRNLLLRVFDPSGELVSNTTAHNDARRTIGLARAPHLERDNFQLPGQWVERARIDRSKIRRSAVLPPPSPSGVVGSYWKAARQQRESGRGDRGSASSANRCETLFPSFPPPWSP